MLDRRLLIGSVVGLLIGAGLVLAVGPGSDDDDGDDVDTSPVDLPERVGSLMTLADAVVALGNADVEDLLARSERNEAAGAEVVSEARGGAAAVVGDYATSDIEVVTVVAVRAPSSPLIAYQFGDPADLGLATPPEEVVPAGAVECLVRNLPTPADDEPEPGDQFVTLCQRTDGDLTVQVVPRSQFEVAEVADMVDDAWRHVTGER